MNPVYVNTTDKFVSISTGYYHSCGLLENGTLMCWGYGASGQLGYGGITQQNNPVYVNTTNNFVAISAGDFHSCGVLENGTSMCWGDGGYGRLGYGGITQQNNPVYVNTTNKFVSISAGYYHSCGVLENRTSMCWGYGANGQLGYGGITQQNNPTYYVNTTNKFVSLSAGTYHTCGVLENGTSMCWGYGASGQLGYGGITQQNNPTYVNTTNTFDTPVIGTDTNVANGTDAITTWYNLTKLRTHLWRVSVTDGEDTTNSLIWKFTTKEEADTTAPVLNFTSPTQPNNTAITRNWTEVNITIDEQNLDTFKFNWDTTNYTFYDVSLVLAMNFNNNSDIGENSTHTVDISKYGNNGTIGGNIVWTSYGRFGGAYDFDGENDYIEVDNSSSLNLGTNNFTINVWFKSSTTTTGGSFIGKIYDVLSGTGGDGWALSIDSNGRLMLSLSDIPGDDPTDYRTPVTYNFLDKEWHNVIVVANRAGNAQWYVDGVYIDSDDISARSGNLSNDYPLFIAANYNKGAALDNYFNGTLDGIRIYNRTLSADEALMHYNSELSKHNSTQYRFYNNITNLTDGTYTYYGWANDTAENSNKSETRTLTIDTNPNNPPAAALNNPPNGSTTSNNWVLLNATVTDADNDNMTVNFYANNNSNGLNDSEGLVYIAENVANGTTLTYNLMALPIKPSEANLSLLMHFDNRSEFGEHTQRNVANAVYDFSGNGNNGTLGNATAGTAPTWNVTGGKLAGAFEFDGTDDFINCGNDPLLDITNNLTLEAWVNFDTISDSAYYTGIVAKWCYECGGRSYGLFKEIGASNNFSFHIWDTDNRLILSDSVFATDTWYHVVGTYNGTMVMYVNGVQQTQTLNSGNIATSTSPVTIGIFDNNNNFCFNGSIDEVAIYNRTLSATEILNHYRLGEGKYYWKVNASDSVLSNESDVWEFTVSHPPVISSYTPAKQLQIEDERGPSYNQSYPYIQKSRTLNASATLSSTDGVGGVRFIVDQGKAGETIVNDTDTSDTLFSAQFSGLLYGNHTLDITILDTSLVPLSGAGQIESIDPFWIVPYIIQFVGDSITISNKDDTTCDVLNLTDVTISCNAVTSDNFLELPCWDNDAVVSYRDYTNGIHIFYSNYAKSIYGTYVFGNNEAESGITAEGTHSKLQTNFYGYAARFTSLDGNISNADLFGPTHAYVMLGLNDKRLHYTETDYEANLTKVVNDIHNKGISYENITLLYPTYSPTYDVSNYLDNIDAVSSNFGTRLIKDLYTETKANYYNSEKSWYFTDNLHFTRAGSRNISRIIAEKSTWLNTGKATYAVFNGSGTTDFNNLSDITNVSDATLQTNTTKITWYNNVNAYGADFDTNVDFGFAFVDVNAIGLNSTFNTSANVTLYNLPWSETPAIFEDGSPCQDCTINFYSGGNFSFNVTHFTNYSAGANANLSIWDDTDPEGGSQTKYSGDQIKFYANYTNITSGESINGTGVYCNISFNVSGWSAWEEMTFNSSTLLYDYNRSFSFEGTYDWNVTCNGSVLGYESLNTSDNVTISSSTPTTFNISVRVIQSRDDAEENLDSGNVTCISTDLELINDNGVDQEVGVRFQDVNIPNSATINSAYLEFEIDHYWDGSTNLTIFCEGADNPIRFSAVNNNITNRTKTSLSVDWNNVASPAVDEKLQTPDIASIVQVIVNRAGWTANNSMVFIINGTGRREVESYDGANSGGEADTAAPLLVVNYTTGGGSDNSPNVSLNNPSNGSSTANNWTVLNTTVTDADNDNMTVYFYANNNSNGLNASEGLVYIEEKVANGSTVTYNLTALPVKPTEDGLVMLMHFDNRSDYGENYTHVYDFSGNERNGTVIGDPVYNTSGGKFGGGYEFDGSGDYVTTPDNSLFNITDNLTVEAWVKFDTTDSGYDGIVAKWCAGCGGDSYGIFKETGSSRYFSFHIYSGGNRQILSDSAFATDTWYHVVGTYNGTTMLMYVNGVQQAQTLNSGSIASTSAAVTIGSFEPESKSWWLDGAIDEAAIYNVTLSPEEVLNHYRLGEGKYYWKVNASDGVLSNESDVWQFTVGVPGEATYSEFNGSGTTDFNNLADITNVSDATLHINNTAKITWYSNVNAYGADFDTNVDFGFAFVDVNATGLNSTFNSSANVTLYNLPWSETPAIFEDGSPCQDCQLNFYSGGNLSFNVTHFTNYSAGANANLSIWDDTDPEGGSQTKHIDEQVNFYANYTNVTSGESINGSGVYCNISFNVTPNGPFGMTFNASSLLYEYNRSFSSSGTFNWNVTCNGSVLGYEDLNVTDTVTVSASNNPPAITMNKPDNGSTTPNNRTVLNATVTDADKDNMTVCFYANNNSNGLNDSEGLVYIGENVANGTTLTYNLTALPIKPSESNLSLLMHFDNRSEFGEHTQRNVANAVYDFSGNGNNGTLGNAAAGTAPTWNGTGGEFAGAFEFDGGDDINAGDVMPAGAYTKVAWVKRGDGIFNNNIISGNNNHAFWAPTPSFHLSAGHNGVWNSVEDSVALEVGEWYHVTVTFDPTVNSGQMVLYKNGVQVDSATGVATQADSSTTYIGRFESGNNWKGTIDEVAIYNRALSSAEIKAHYSLGDGKYYWKVNASDSVLTNESDVWEFTVSTPLVISSYTPAKQLQIEDERGPSYKQSYPYLQKSRTLNASATLSSTDGVGGVRFIVDQGKAGETIVNDTDTSDTLFNAEFSSLCYGNHTLDIIILDTNQDPLSGAGQTESIDPFWIVPYIIQFVGDSITISYADDTTCDVLNLTDVTSGCNAVTSDNFLELPCWDNDAVVSKRAYSNGIHIFYSDYAKCIYGTYVFGNNEAQSGITAEGTYTKFQSNIYGFADRFTSLDENGSNADLFGPTHAYVMLGLNDKRLSVNEATYEAQLSNVVNDTYNKGISYENITLLYPTYSPTYDVSNYLDNIDAVSNNLGTRLITDLYNETKDNYYNSEKSWYFTDNLHFTRAGSRNISRIIAEKSTWLNTGKATYTEFNGSGTTDFNNLPDITNVSNATLQTSTAKITWYNNVNAYGANFDTNVDFGFAFVDVNATGLNSTFNSSANVTLYNLPWSETPAIFEDGSPCQDCQLNFYSGGNLAFNVTHFTNYSAGANANLSIWDDTDPKGGSQTKCINETINFYANYTNITSGESINGTGVYCNISFHVTPNGPFGMPFNASSLLYEYNRSFSSSGTFNWNVTCNGSDLGYEDLNVTDTVTVSASNNPPAITMNKPDNGSTTSNNWTVLNATVTDADDDPMTVYFYGKNETSADYTLFQTNSNVANDTAVTFGWGETERTVDNSMVLLMHFNNDSAYGETDTHVYDFSGNGNNGTMSGATISTMGKFGKSISFSSTGTDEVSIPDSDVFGITDEMTVSAWIYPTNINDYGRIIAKAWADNVEPWVVFALTFDGSVNHKAWFMLTTGGDYALTPSTTAIPTNAWTYVVGTYDGSNISIYINGIKENSTSKTGNLNTNTQPVLIGRNQWVYQQDFEGYIDEVVIYNRSLSADEISNHYRLEKGKYYWKVNATDGVLSNESDVWQFTVEVNATPTCTHGDICVDASGWWRNNGTFNASTTQIQDAIKNASTGNKIYVYNGTYSENVNVNKRLTIEGEGADVVNVTNSTAEQHVFEVTVDYVNISGFNVTGATGNTKAGIYIVKDVNHCNISGNTASNNYYGIYLNSSSSDNSFANNTISDNTWDLYIKSSVSAFTNNTLSGTTVSFIYAGDVSLKSESSPGSDPNGRYNIGEFINATNHSAGAWMFLNFSYSDSDVIGLDESSLAVWKYNGTAWVEDGWNGTRHLDTANNVVGVNITSFSVFAPLAPPAPVFPGWNYHQLINISNTAQNLSYYPVRIDLNSSNVGTNWNWTEDENATRFTYYNYSTETETEIPFWIESWNSTAETSTIWVNVTFLANNTNTTIYMYYGNSSASSASNGTNTFEFFDDFDNTNNWEKQKFYSFGYDHVSFSASDSKLAITSTGNNRAGPTTTTPHLSQGQKFEAKVVTRLGSAQTIQLLYHSGGNTYENIPYASNVYEVWIAQNNVGTERYDGGYGSGEDVISYPYIEYRTNDYVHFGSRGKGEVYKEDCVWDNTNFKLAFYTCFATTIVIDWVFVRKYAFPEPSVSISIPVQPLSCSCGDICVNATGWWRNNGTFNASDMPIQYAINNATVADSIYVYNGSYTENVDVSKQLTLTGEGTDVVNITNSTAEHHVFNVTANYVNISRFNVTGATGNMKAGIYIGNRADHCNISYIIGSNNYIGIYLNSSSSDNLFANNIISDNTWDLHIKSSASAFTNNTLNGTTVSLTYGGNVSLKGVGSPASDPTGWNNLTKFINATNQSAGAWLLLNFTYSDADVSGLNESSLKVWKQNGTVWIEDGWNGSRYLDAANNVVGVNITSFSVFAPMGSSGNPPVVTLNRPENDSFILNNWALLNATVTDADNDDMTVYFYANDNNNGLNDSEGLVYIAEDVANGSTVTYNLTALPVKPSEDGLVMLMHFDNRSEFGENDTHVYDFSGNENNGTVNGNPDYNISGGKFAGAYEFDGDHDYIRVRDDPSLRITETLTIESWVNFNSLGSSLNYIGLVAKWDYYGSGFGYGLFREPTTNNFSFHLASGYHSGNTFVQSDNVPSLHEWYHVVGTYNGSTLLLYINGVLQAETATISGIYSNTDPVTIGSFEVNNKDFWFNGTIDEVAIYNRTLSADEILNHYRLGEGKYYWKVNASDGVLSNESDVWQFTVFSETLEVRNQTSVSVISSINFSGACGATVTEPYNNVDGSPQNIASKTPVVTIHNPSSSADYKIWLKVQNESGWTDIISNEKFNVTADDASPGAVSSWATLTSWGSYEDTGVTVSAGTHKDLYLAFDLKGSGSGTSKLSILGEID